LAAKSGEKLPINAAHKIKPMNARTIRLADDGAMDFTEYGPSSQQEIT
jgi:hypothetical protein